MAKGKTAVADKTAKTRTSDVSEIESNVELKKKARKTYWIGLLPEIELDGQVIKTPFQQVVLGGQNFPLDMFTLREEPDGKIVTDSRKVGNVVQLTDEQVEKIKQACKEKIVRIDGPLAGMYSIKNKYYQAEEGDLFVGRFIYMTDPEEINKRIYPSAENDFSTTAPSQYPAALIV